MIHQELSIMKANAKMPLSIASTVIPEALIVLLVSKRFQINHLKIKLISIYFISTNHLLNLKSILKIV